MRSGKPSELAGGLMRLRVRLDRIPEGLIEAMGQWSEHIERLNERELSLTLPGDTAIPDLNAWLVGQGLQVYALAPQQISLEELFVQIMET